MFNSKQSIEVCLSIETQGYINRSNLPTGLGARRVSWEHVENMELRCALVIIAPVCSVLCVSEHRALCLRAPCSVSQSTVLCVSEHRALCLRATCSGSQSTVLWFSEHRALCLRALCSVCQSTVLCVSEHSARCLRAPCSGSQST